jgi:hypothetical protein
VRATQICWFVAVAALAVATSPVPEVQASEADVQVLESSFANGPGNWTSTSSCAPLCSVTNTVDPGPGAGGPGSATVIYTTLGGLLGGLATGTSTWKSPTFTWGEATPASATLSFARRAAVSGLLSVGGSVTSRIQLDDLTSGTITTVVSESVSADTSFVTHSFSLEPSLLKPSHSYCLLLHTSLSAAALLSGIRVSYDDISLDGAIASSDGNGPDGAGATGGQGGPKGMGANGTSPPTGIASPPSLRLSAPRVVHFARGRAMTLRLHALRAGKAAGHVAIVVRFGRRTRRISTGQDGVATMRVSFSSRAPIRISFRAGAATATTWARPVGR